MSVQLCVTHYCGLFEQQVMRNETNSDKGACGKNYSTKEGKTFYECFRISVLVASSCLTYNLIFSSGTSSFQLVGLFQTSKGGSQAVWTVFGPTARNGSKRQETDQTLAVWHSTQAS